MLRYAQGTSLVLERIKDFFRLRCLLFVGSPLFFSPVLVVVVVVPVVLLALDVVV